MNELARVILYYENLFMCAMQRLFEFKILPFVRLFIKFESWPVVGFCPHVTSTGVFGINLSTLYPNFGSFKGGVQHNEPGNRTIGLYHSHLAIGKSMVGAAPGVRKTVPGAL